MAQVEALLSVSQYIDKRARTKISPRTIENYREAIRVLGIDLIDPANINPIWQRLLTQLLAGKSYVYVKLAIVLVKATLKRGGVQWVPGSDYYDLTDELKEMDSDRPERGAYDVDSVRKLLRYAQSDMRLYRAVMLMATAGLRITACKNLEFSNFRKVPQYNVRLFEVTSKGKKYTAAISEKFFQDLVISNAVEQSPYLVEYEENAKVPFDKYWRTQLTRILYENNDMAIKKGRSLFHSLRHYFATEAAKSGLLDEEISLLLGHTPNSIAFKYYVETGQLSERIAAIYAKIQWPDLHQHSDSVFIGKANPALEIKTAEHEKEPEKWTLAPRVKRDNPAAIAWPDDKPVFVLKSKPAPQEPPENELVENSAEKSPSIP